jgi:drug/metabolite transporter (DMT)-like permease
MNPAGNHKKRGLVFILLSALIFGSYGTWAKLIGESQGIFYPNWTRALGIALVLFPIVYLTKQIVPIKRADWRWMATYLACTSATQAPLFYAFNHMDVGTATLLFFVTMLLTMYAIGFLFLGEKISTVKVVSFIIAGIGLYVTFSFSITAFALFAALMAILNGFASGSEVSFSKKLTGNYSTLYMTWLSWIFIVITNGAISLLLGEVQYLPAFDMYMLYQIGYAIAGITGFWFIIEGLKYTEASIGGLLGLLEIVFSLAFGILIFHEGLTAKVIVGAIFILVAAALPHVVELFKRKTI